MMEHADFALQDINWWSGVITCEIIVMFLLAKQMFLYMLTQWLNAKYIFLVNYSFKYEVSAEFKILTVDCKS